MTRIYAPVRVVMNLVKKYGRGVLELLFQLSKAFIF